VFGVAEVGRFFTQLLKKTDIPFSIYDIDTPFHKRLDSINLKTYQPFFTRKIIYRKTIFFVNADALPFFAIDNPRLFSGKHNAAVFFWEFDDYFNFPEAFKSINEVIAFTDFIATAVRKAAPARIKVTKLNFPFIKNWEVTKTATEIREQLGIKNEEFIFIFNFDFYSVYERKNPEAILNAFEIAFLNTDSVRLILKTIHADETNNNFKKFQSVIKGMKLNEKIIMINDNLDRDEFMSVINACDCYISLHRSEGLGLGMLEAMSMAKPVIATRYGGNMDFMNDENSLLVDYQLIPVKEGAEPYQPGWLWADPDVQQSAEFMQKLYKDRVFAERLGNGAQDYINQHYNQHSFIRDITTWMNA
jgi:glycosyltransferase involved in cell wall biosynthesis